jgi:hypothetical protein
MSLLVLPVITLMQGRGSMAAAFFIFLYFFAFASGSIFAANRLNGKHLPTLTATLLASSLIAGAYAIGIFPIAYFDHEQQELENIVVPIAGLIGATFFGWKFWRRIRFPILPAAIAAIWTFSIYTVAGEVVNGFWDSDPHSPIPDILMLISGVSILAWAVWWDITDIRRETERSQIAFWLHCCAGFAITHSVASMIGILGRNQPELGAMIGNGSILVIIIHIALAVLVSVTLDRRTLFSGACLSLLLMKMDGGMPIGIPIAGILLLSVSVSWNSIRAALLNRLPVRITANVPRVELMHNSRRPTRQRLDYWFKKSRTI